APAGQLPRRFGSREARADDQNGFAHPFYLIHRQLPWASAAAAAGLLRVSLRERDERPHRRTLRALRRVRPVAVAPVRPGDVEVGPLGAGLDRRVEERRGLDRAALPAGAVREVGDVALDLVAVLVGERHRPETVPRLRTGRADLLDERGRPPEEAAEVVAERDRDRAGELR